MSLNAIASSENIEDIISNDRIYVDKTEYIYNMIRQYKRGLLPVLVVSENLSH